MNIEGYFGSPKAAKQAVKELKRQGFNKSYVDLNDHYMDERNVQTNQPGTETSPSLSGLILESSTHAVDRSKAPLTAANPMVSGFGRFEEVADFNCKVIVETEDGKVEIAKKIIKNEGGELSNPNVEIPKNLENIDI